MKREYIISKVNKKLLIDKRVKKSILWKPVGRIKIRISCVSSLWGQLGIICVMFCTNHQKWWAAPTDTHLILLLPKQHMARVNGDIKQNNEILDNETFLMW